MEKVITLYEFDKFEQLPLTSIQAKKFKSYLGSVWQSRSLCNSFYDTQSSTKQPFFNFEDNSIQARNYVGYVQFEGLEIQVFPKIFKNAKQVSKQLIIEHLCYFLSYTRSFSFPFTKINSGSTPIYLNFLDLWYYVFLGLIEQDAMRQAYHSFETLQRIENQAKGKVDFQKYTQKHLPQAQWQKLPLTYSTLTWDNIFTQTIKYCVKQIYKKSTNLLIHDKASKVLGLLGNVRDKNISYRDTLKIKFNPLLEGKQMILDNCKLLLLNEQVAYSQGLKCVFGLLLPMEKVFEEFMFGFVQTHFSDWEAISQKRGYLAKSELDKEVFKLYSDIYLPQKNYILDTKYKLRSLPFQNARSGISESDLYQMLSYGIGKNCQDIFLIYPASFGEENLEGKQSKFTIESQLLYNNVIRITASDLSITASVIDTLDEKIKRSIEAIFEEQA